MTQEITKKQNIILMKSGLVLWVDKDRTDNLSTILESGSGHRFVKIDGRMINSAEMEGVYTPFEFEELQKIKQGYTMCVYKKWHARKEVCDCARDIWRKTEESRRQAEDARINRDLTPEERKKNIEFFQKIRDDMIKKGVFKGRTAGYVIKRSAMVKYKEDFGTDYSLPEGATIDEDL